MLCDPMLQSCKGLNSFIDSDDGSSRANREKKLADGGPYNQKVVVVRFQCRGAEIQIQNLEPFGNDGQVYVEFHQQTR